MPNDDPVQIRNIDGLGPVKAEISSTPFATGRGELYQGSSTGKRNIVLTLGLNPNWVDQSMSSLRQLLYRYFMPQAWSKFRFISDEIPTVYINGVVESVEPNIFSQDPEMQVSIICPKPDLIDVDTTLIHGVTAATSMLVEYAGTVPSGFELHIHASDAVPSFTGDVLVSTLIGSVFQELKLQAVTVDATKYLKLNTTRTTRKIYTTLYEDNQDVNILAKMEKNSDWPEFNPGTNALMVKTSTPGLDWTLGYFNRFGGL